ncbi:MAG: integrase family protein [Neobacillus sp.]|nr:integrase family protein [Neobacillus sp.]
MASSGTIQKRGENSWFLSVSSGFDGAGKRIRHTKTVKVSSDAEAKKQLALFVAEIEKGQVATSGKMTLDEYFEYWEENYCKNRHAPKTIEYNKGLFKRISQALGHKRIDKITPQNLLAFYSNLAEAGVREDPNATRRKTKVEQKKTTLSPNTIRKYHVLLHTLFAKAEQWQLVAYNPVAKVEAPKAVKVKKKIYDEEATGKFLYALQKEEVKHQTMAMLCINTGMRRGELFGLQWHHIDFKAKTIKIEQASQYMKDKGIFIKSTKNESSERTLTLPDEILVLLRQHKADQLEQRLKLGGIEGKWKGAEEVKDDFVFTTWDGQLAHPDSLNSWLKKFIVKHNLPHATPHTFRHMTATYLITSGTDLRTVAGKLGHANTTTTSVVYAHLLKTSEAETTNTMSNFMKQVTDKAKIKALESK